MCLTASQPKQTKDPKVDERQVNDSYFIDEKMKLEREQVSSTQLTPVSSVTPPGFELSLKDLGLKHHIHFSVNQLTSKIPVGPLAFIVICRRPKCFKNLTLKFLFKVLCY